MKWSISSSIVLATVALGNVLGVAAGKGPSSGTFTVIPGRYIVEFDDAAHMTAAGMGKRSRPHDEMYDRMQKRGIPCNILNEYSSDIFTGAALSLPSEQDLAELAAVQGILSISPVTLINVPDVASQSDVAQWTRNKATKRGLLGDLGGLLGLGPKGQGGSGGSSSGSPSSSTDAGSGSMSAGASASPSVSGNSSAGANTNVGQNSKTCTGRGRGKTCTTGSSGSASSTGAGTTVAGTTTTGSSNSTANSTSTAAASSATSNMAPVVAPTAAFGQTGFSTLPQLQIDRIQAQGNKGKGVKIGIIDGGVDYTRPVLGGCFGDGCKIAGGYDFVGDNFDGSNSPQPDDDPLDICYSHGTITTGIIGANDNVYGAPGVAPEASLYNYRVFGCNGATTNEIVIAAMQRAYNDNMDVINLSLGEIAGWTENVLSVVAARLVAKGTVVTTSAGNEGQEGAFYAYGPGTGQGVINVGSSDNAIYAGNQATLSDGHAPITYIGFQSFTLAQFPLTPKQFYPLYTYSNAGPNGADGCTVPDGTGDLAGKVVIVNNDNCAVNTKAGNAYYQGAIGILVANSPNTPPFIRLFPTIPYGMITPEDGQYIFDQLAANKSIEVAFDYSPVTVPNTFTGNTTSFFSEIGPTNDMFFAPSIVAPGSSIISVIPLNPDFFYYNWSITDGTSWSSAFAAGAAALYMNAKGTNNINPMDLKTALESTSVRLPVSVSDNSLETVAAQGSGKFQLYDALNTPLTVSPSEITLNDTANINPNQFITIKNTGNKGQWYNLKHIPAGTALSIGTNNEFADEPVPQTNQAANVIITQPAVYLFPGQSTKVLIIFTPPWGLDAKRLPVYSGWINVQAQGCADRVQVPYLGVAANLKKQAVLDPAHQPYVNNSQPSYSLRGGDYPTVIYNLLTGTPVLVIDLVDANANLGINPTYHAKRATSTDVEERDLMPRRLLSLNLDLSIGLNLHLGGGLLNTLCLFTHLPSCPNNPSGTFQNVPVIGNVYQGTYLARNSDGIDGQGNTQNTFQFNNGTFTNGTAIPNGNYKFLLRTLRTYGDITNENDYEAWLSGAFSLNQ